MQRDADDTCIAMYGVGDVQCEVKERRSKSDGGSAQKRGLLFRRPVRDAREHKRRSVEECKTNRYIL